MLIYKFVPSLLVFLYNSAPLCRTREYFSLRTPVRTLLGESSIHYSNSKIEAFDKFEEKATEILRLEGCLLLCLKNKLDKIVLWSIHKGKIQTESTSIEILSSILSAWTAVHDQ